MDQQVEGSLINCCLKVWCFLLDESCSTVESPINMSWTMLPRKIFKFWSKGRKNTGHRGIQGKVHLIPFPSGFRIHAENFITEELMKTNWTSFVCWLFRGSKLISFNASVNSVFRAHHARFHVCMFNCNPVFKNMMKQDTNRLNVFSAPSGRHMFWLKDVFQTFHRSRITAPRQRRANSN